MKPIIALLCVSGIVIARETPKLPDDPYFSAYTLAPAPEPGGLMLKPGAKLAICGDSITEQKRYSLIMETYLTACMPQLGVTCRQYGWSGEQAGGFAKRMRNDVLRFKPDVATTCYGMNDFRYVPYQDDIAAEYRKNQTAVLEAFQQAGCQMLLGSPGIIDSVPHWVKSAKGTQQDLNFALMRFRNLGVEIAAANKARFADVYQPMLVADWKAGKTYGENFRVAGKDGVHPNWAGHLIMAYAFLKGLGLDGDLGSLTILGGEAKGADGHEVKSIAEGKLTVTSKRFPFSPGPGDVANDDSIRAGLALVPFDSELNRFTLRIEKPTAARYAVTWGKETKEYAAADLEKGVNLAADFIEHPLLDPFRKVWDAAAKKQAYETRQIKELFHGPEGAADPDGIAAVTEKVHAKLAADLAASFQPVEHVIEIKPLP